MTATPDGLTPGPDGTFYGPLADVPSDWEATTATDGNWMPVQQFRLRFRASLFDAGISGADLTAIVQARPAPLGAPKGIEFGPDGWLVTTWKHMRDRPDLDQWEYARVGSEWSDWVSCNLIANDTPDDFPVIVRRRDGDQ